jgi:hypothetical protein
VPTRSPFHDDDVVLVGSKVVRIHIDKSYVATLAMRVTVLYASGATAAQQIDATATVGALLCTVRQGDGAMAPPVGQSDIATADTIGDGRAFDMHAGLPPRQLLASAVMSDVVADGSTIYCDFAPDAPPHWVHMSTSAPGKYVATGPVRGKLFRESRALFQRYGKTYGDEKIEKLLLQQGKRTEAEFLMELENKLAAIQEKQRRKARETMKSMQSRT